MILKTRHYISLTAFLLLLILLSSCDLFRRSSDGNVDGGIITNTNVDGGSLSTDTVLPPIHFAFTVHLEGHTLPTDEAVTRYFNNIRDYADLAIAHNLPVTWEVRNILGHLSADESHLLLELQNEGHGIGFHADSGGSSMSQTEFETDLQEGANTLALLGITSHHVSGICSDKDWVTAARSANFKAVNGIVDYCLKSLPEADQPAHVRDCTNPADCHAPYAYGPSEALFPWKADLGTNWTTAHEEGVLIIPSSGTITCAAELAAAPGESITGCEFLNNDIVAVMNYIDEALTYREAGKFHQLTFVWSYGSSIPMGRFRTFLEGIQTRIETGELSPVTTPQLMLKYEQFLGNMPTD